MFFAETIETACGSMLDRAPCPISSPLASTFSVAYSLRFIRDVFFGPPADRPAATHPHEPPRWMRFPVEFLVVALPRGRASFLPYDHWTVSRRRPWCSVLGSIDAAVQPRASGTASIRRCS